MATKGRPPNPDRPNKRPLKAPIWERQDGESDAAWHSFVVYREGGRNRSHKEVKAAAGLKAARRLNSWASDWSWTERCVAYDREMDRILRDEKEKALREKVREMVDRHIGLGVEFQRLAQVELRRHLKKIGADVPQPDMGARPTLPLSEVRSAAEFGIALERKNRGEPETVNKTIHAGELDVRISFADLMRAATERRRSR